MNNAKNETSKESREELKIDTSVGSLTAEPYDDGCAKGIKISVNGDIVALIDVTEEEEIRLIGYKENYDEPSLHYSINR